MRYSAVHDRVEGWLHHHAADAICDLLNHQSVCGISGGLLEIGVHHGRLLIFLALSARRGEPIVGIDIFEDQHLNIDFSGYGSRGIVAKNLAEYAPGCSVVLRKADSTTLTSAPLIDEFGQFRAISIDGGHTAEITLSDLKLAERICCDAGLVILDDILNSHWPGVIEGYARYALSACELVPVCIGENKLFLAKGLANAIRYREHIKNGRLECITKSAVLFWGHEIPVIGGGPCPFFVGLTERIAKWTTRTPK